MSQGKREFLGAKIIELPRWTTRDGDLERRLSQRDQVVSEQIVGILKDMLLSWRLPTPSGQNS